MAVNKSPTDTIECFCFCIRKENRFFSNRLRKPLFVIRENAFLSMNINDKGERETCYLDTPAKAYASRYGWGVNHEPYSA